MTKTKKKSVGPLRCDCGRGLVLEDTYGLVCHVCGVRIAGPFEHVDEVPDYVAAADCDVPGRA